MYDIERTFIADGYASGLLDQAKEAASREKALGSFLEELRLHATTRRFHWLPSWPYDDGPLLGYRVLDAHGYVAVLHLTRRADVMTGLVFARSNDPWPAFVDAALDSLDPAQEGA